MNAQSNLNKKIGILGGGQLGRMLLQEGINLNLDLHFLDAKNAPCEANSKNFNIGSIVSYEDVYNFGKSLDFITIEIENVNVEALYQLEKEGVKVFPQPHIIELIQDKGLQKQFYQKNGIPTSPFLLIENKEELANSNFGFPCIQKLRKGGYDGKGVQKLNTISNLEDAFTAPSLLEELIDFEKELSVIVARTESGETKCFPVVEQEFNAEANLVEFLFSPADITNEVAKEAEKIAIQIIDKLGMVGLLAVELFLTKEGKLLVNEIAPRPHNSGHQTIEGNITSQFGQHLRSIINLPLGDTSTVQPAVMINLLGAKNHTGKATYNGLPEALSQPGVYPHLYGKKDTKPFRKMGHITVTNPDISAAKKIARNLLTTVEVVAE
ncbi:MAG: 5-(carboxyamino)imidazole ribonucleotide synthase [Crocinitomicaceae bacterium]